MGTNEDEPAATRSNSAKNIHLDAGPVHLHFGAISRRARHLLGVEQFIVDYPAVGHYGSTRGEGGAV